MYNISKYNFSFCSFLLDLLILEKQRVVLERGLQDEFSQIYKDELVSAHVRLCFKTLNMESYQQHCDRSVILIPIFKWGNAATLEKFFESSEFMSPVSDGAEFQSLQHNFKAKVAVCKLHCL